MSEFSNDLQTALHEALGDPSKRRAFVELLMASEVVVLVPPAGTGGPRTLKAGEPVDFIPLQYGDRSIIPFFTSADLAMTFVESVFQTQVGVMGFNGRDLFELVVGVGLAMNPSPDGAIQKLFEPNEVSAIVGRETSLNRGQINETVSPMVGRAEVPLPDEIVGNLRQFFSSRVNVVSARYGWIEFPGEPGRYFVNVITDDPSQDLGGIEDVLNDAARGGLNIDVYPQGANEAPVLDAIEPFYP